MAGRSKVLTYAVPLLAALALGGAGYSIATSQPERPLTEPAILPPSQPCPAGSTGADPGARPGEGPALIGAVGLVEPAGEAVAVGATVSGVVSEVRVAPGDRVERGDVLFTLDRRTAEAGLAARRQDLAAAQARLAQTLARVPALEATADAARAALAQAEAELNEARDLVRIAQSLTGGSAISEREATRRRNAAGAAEARVAQSRAQAAQAAAELSLYTGEGAPTVAVDQAAVEQARAALREAETALDLLAIRAPSAGTVLQVNTRPGQFAQAGVLTTALMILGRLDPLHVRVDIDEADVPRFHPDASAQGSLRGAAERRVGLTLVRVDPYVVPKTSLTGAGTERVDTRVLRAVYRFDPKDLPGAYPGQQMDLFIEARRENRAAARLSQTLPR